LIEQWNGTSWVLVLSPNGDATHNDYLGGVGCAGPSECWGVGTFNPGTAYESLIVFRTLPLLQITAVSRPGTGISAGHFLIDGKAVADSSVNIYASPDLVTSFTLLGSASADVNGLFHYDDAGAVTIMPPRRFYHAGYP
jgi:hypothetical protein